MKKKWTYEQYSQKYTCYLNEEEQTINIQEPHYCHTLDMATWLTTDIYRLPLKIELEVTKSILLHLKMSDLSQEQLRHYKFWTHLDGTKLNTSIKFPTIKPYPHWNDSYLKLSSLGAQFVETTFNGKKIVQDERRIDHLFFHGPSKALALNDRVELKNLLLSALSPESGLSLSDGFPLFDYSKLPFRRFEHSEKDSDCGKFWILENSYITIGGWSRQGKDGGANLLSIETAWPNLKGLSGPFETHREEVYTILKNAIIKE